MKPSDAFGSQIVAIKELTGRLARRVTLMEVCGTHTVAICKSGLRDLVGDRVRLISGPGCPVCVSTQGYIDACVELALSEGVTLATYGDMLRVPGSGMSLAEARAAGGGVLTVYSALDSVKWAREHPDERVVFAAVGFETTAPATALAVKKSADGAIGNWSALSSHKRILPAMMALLAADDIDIDAFLCPGHVSVIVGPEEYEPVAATGRPSVVTGFEALDVAIGVRMILAQIVAGRAEVENAYRRAVKPGGNPTAKRLLDEVFEHSDEVWRGLGVIPQSGLSLKGAFGAWDAREVHGVKVEHVAEPAGCLCGEVIRGAVEPEECALFAGGCTPAHPVGPCMVSREGSCSAHYKYARTPR